MSGEIIRSLALPCAMMSASALLYAGHGKAVTLCAWAPGHADILHTCRAGVAKREPEPCAAAHPQLQGSGGASCLAHRTLRCQNPVDQLVVPLSYQSCLLRQPCQQCARRSLPATWRYEAACSEVTKLHMQVGGALLDPAPLAVDVRQPPLHPKRSAMLRLLAAANGSLFAGACCARFWHQANHMVAESKLQLQLPAQLVRYCCLTSTSRTASCGCPPSCSARGVWACGGRLRAVGGHRRRAGPPALQQPPGAGRFSLAVLQ